MTRRELYEILIKMAIRHPDVLQYTKEFINTGFMEEINRDINEYLQKTCGLDFEYEVIKVENGEEFNVTKYIDSFEYLECISINKIPKFVKFGKFEIQEIEDKELKILPTKLLPKDQNKGGIMLSSINDELFRWYDAFKKISNETPYHIDPTNNETKDAKRKTEILHLYIINKQWQELL
jgi:hypothetical protein